MTDNPLQTATVPSTDRSPANGAARTIADWPIDARAMMEVISRDPHFGGNRRRGDRKRFNVAATATFTNSKGHVRTAPIYTRNLSPGHVAFICQCLVTAGTRITVSVPLPDGGVESATGTARRCRQFYEGWFDCVARFDPPPKPQERRWFGWGRKKADAARA